MVLETYDIDRDMLIFKKTYDDPDNGQTKMLEIERNDPNAPKEFYFVHLAVENTESEMDVDTICTDIRKSAPTRNRLSGRIIERDEFFDEVVEIIGSRYFNSSNGIVWV